MKKILVIGLIVSLRLIAQAQEAQPSQSPERNGAYQRVPLSETASDSDSAGRVVLAARLRTPQLSGSLEAPATNAQVVIENRGSDFYGFASGWVTFYDAGGVRCGEAMWTINAFAPGEAVERDLPGLRLTCAPATWRVVATSLLTRAGDVAKPVERTPPVVAASPLQINVNGQTLPVQIGNPIEIKIGTERVRIVVSPAPQ